MYFFLHLTLIAIVLTFVFLFFNVFSISLILPEIKFFCHICWPFLFFI